MDISYPIKIVTGSYNEILKETTEYYNKLIEYLLHIIEKEQTDIITQDVNKHENERQMRLEALIHATKNNEHPKYEDFDKNFPQFPSYIRRAAEKKAIGIYKSWYTNHLNWEVAGKNGTEPRLQYKHNTAPTFYNKNAYLANSKKGENYVQLKLWNGKKWVWTDIPVRHQDTKYINKLGTQYKMSNAPTLTKRGHAWELRFSFKVKLDLADENEQFKTGTHRICAIDLGVNTDATCCIMEPDGTVVARRFINFGAEKDRILNAHKRIREAQSNGARKLKKMWRKVNRLNNDLVIKIVNEIVDFAVEYSCCAVACEYLDFSSGKRKKSKGKRGKRGWRLSLWRYRDVYHRLCIAAHKFGLRVHQVCAWGTSRLAFDGSGRVSRGRYIVDENGESLGLPYSVVRFASGKFYSADLNAVYNIGARYYIRFLLDFLKARLSSEDFGALSAKVPQCSARSGCVLSDLINLWGVACSSELAREAA